MNLRQRLFCERYMATGNGEQSAIDAGYSAHSARSSAQKLLQRAEIQRYIAQKSTEIATENIASIQEIQTFWTNIMNDIEEPTKNRLRASELLAKHKGMFSADW